MISSLNKAVFCCALLAAPAFADDIAPAEPVAASPVQPNPAQAAASVPAQPAMPHDTITIMRDGSNMVAAPAPVVPLSSAAMPAPTIAVENVSAPSIADIGIMDEKNGGLPATLWKGSTRESAGALLTYMHAGVSNPALRDLTERALLTSAPAPAGSSSEWLLQRVQALIAMGSDDKAQALIAAVPDSMKTNELQQVNAQLLLLHGDSAAACKIAETAATGATSPAGETPFWQKLSIFCKALNGHADEANVALDLLRETNATDDAFLQDVVHKFTDKNYVVKATPAHWTLFEVAVLRLAGETDRLKERLDSLPPLAIKYLAADNSLDPKFRDKAQIRAMALGVLPQKDNSKAPQPQPFARNLASDVTTLVASLGTGSTAIEADNAVIARMALDDTASIQDCRRVQRLLTLMEPFGYRITPETWNKVFTRHSRFDGDAPPAKLIDSLNTATSKGDIILLSALVLNSADVDKVGELVMLPVVKALNNAGFSKEARELAHDAVQSYSTH